MGTERRMTAAEFQAQYGSRFMGTIKEPKGSKVKKPQIRLPKLGWDGANKTEIAARDYLQRLYPNARLEFEAITLRLPSGTKYTPDIAMTNNGSVFLFEVKGPYIHNQRSIQAFKEARAHFTQFGFIFMQLVDGVWRISGDEKEK